MTVIGAYITGIGSISQAPRHCYLLLEGLGGLQRPKDYLNWLVTI